MKKLIAVVLSLAMLLCAFGAMAQSAPETVTFYLITMSVDGTTMNAGEMGFSFVLTLNSDGTGAMDAMGEVSELTWERTAEDKLTLIENDTPVEATITEEGLVISEDGTDMFFSQQAPEMLNMGEEIPAASAADFDGTWNCAYVSIEGATMPIDLLGDEWGTLFGDASTVIEIKDGNVALFGDEPVAFTFDNGMLVYSVEGNEASLQSIALTDVGYLAYTLLGALTLYCTPAAQ